jgi:soluble P-type ATPase
VFSQHNGYCNLNGEWNKHLLYNNIMIQIVIPGKEPIEIQYLVCDVNGTLAVDGVLMDGIKDSISSLFGLVETHLLTADTFGRGTEIAKLLGVKFTILNPGKEREQKAAYVRQLGSPKVAAIGQGANDELMIKEAALGICVFSPEGTAIPTLLAAKLVSPDGNSALQLLLHPTRLTASLRI